MRIYIVEIERGYQKLKISSRPAWNTASIHHVRIDVKQNTSILRRTATAGERRIVVDGGIIA